MLTRRMYPLFTFDGEGGGGGPAPVVEAPPKPDASRDAFAEMRRKADEAERRAKAAEDALAERDRKEAEAQGRWEDIAKTEREAREKAEREAASVREERMVERVAAGLKFHNPADVMHRLSPEQRADEALAKTALEQIAKTDKYLVRQDAAPIPELGRVLDPAAVPDPAKPVLTIEDVEAMSPQEVLDRWDDVQKVLKTQQK